VRAVVNVSMGGHYSRLHDRMSSAFLQQGEANIISWKDSLPSASPSHDDVPYAFKLHAMEAAVRQGYSTVLWVDSSIIPVKSLKPLWDLIESQGYWFSANLPYGSTTKPRWTCGEWTCDAALAPLGITREEAFQIPLVIATSFGLDIRHQIAQTFLAEWGKLVRGRTAMLGPWTNQGFRASQDERVLGHRHDQTVASVVAHRLGMKLTVPPKWIVDGLPVVESTVLEIKRSLV